MDLVLSPAILGIGICPGLSTLLVKKLSAGFDKVTKIEFSLLLGLGDHYGNDALAWMLDNLSQSFYWRLQGNKVKQLAFHNKRLIRFFPTEKSHGVYNFNLADQQIVSRTMKQDCVTTYFGLDDRRMTAGLALFAKMQFFRLLRYQWLYRSAFQFAGFSSRFSTQTDPRYAIHVKIEGEVSNQKQIQEQTIVGTNSSETTGKIAAHTACLVMEKGLANKVYYLNELFDLGDFSEFL